MIHGQVLRFDLRIPYAIESDERWQDQKSIPIHIFMKRVAESDRDLPLRGAELNQGTNLRQ
jgi:hypothetical protein